MEKIIIDNFEQINYITKCIYDSIAKEMGLFPCNFSLQFKIKYKERKKLYNYLDNNKIEYYRSNKKIWISFKRLMISKAFVYFYINNIRVEVFNTWVYSSDINFSHKGNGYYESVVKIDVPKQE